MASSIRFIYFGFLTAGLLAAGGCAMADAVTSPIAGVRSSDDPITLNVMGPLELDVESFNGDVMVTVDEFAEWATVRLTRAATHGQGRSQEARASLPEIHYSVRVVPGDLGPRLHIVTGTNHPEPYFQRAHLHITVPEVEGVHVRTSNGRVHARGVQGKIDIETTNGDVRVMTNQPMQEKVTIVNHRGDIDYRVRSESSGRFDAEAIGGRVTHRVQRGQFVINSMTGESRLAAKLNGGENPVTLRTANGNIRIAVVHNPEQVGLYIFD